MNNLEKSIDYTFKDKRLLKCALTHTSFANESKTSSNERLEFLGDSVLSFFVSDHIFKNYKDMPEGELTRLRSSLVCEAALCVFAREIGLGDNLLLGKGEEKSGGRNRDSILADAFEALLAAIFLDGGIENAKKFVYKFVLRELENKDINHSNKDYKTLLQEIIQRNPEEVISYILTGESGPDHDKTFEVEVHLNSNVIGKGSGKSKKAAEEAAAKQALTLMGENI